MASEKIAERCRKLADEAVDDTFPLPPWIDVEVFETGTRVAISEKVSTIFYVDKDKKCHVVGQKRIVAVTKNRLKSIIAEI